MDKWSLILLAFYLLLVFFPFPFSYMSATTQNLTIDQTIINGLITASGILFGLITAIIVTRPEKPPSVLYYIVVGDFGLLLFAGTQLFWVGLGKASLLSVYRGHLRVSLVFILQL